MTTFDKEMQKALEADGEYLRQMTGEDHGPYFLVTCEACCGDGVFLKRVTVHEPGCAFPHDDTDERKCEACDGYGTVLS
ncbi:hypothetical protein AB3480_00735 [Rhizobium mongolense]|uniref:hypothetical protein n=1 Tax=Rhizobium mongolense TaxID=57676 RepID=UPI0034A5CD2B